MKQLEQIRNNIKARRKQLQDAQQRLDDARYELFKYYCGRINECFVPVNKLEKSIAGKKYQGYDTPDGTVRILIYTNGNINVRDSNEKYYNGEDPKNGSIPTMLKHFHDVGDTENYELLKTLKVICS